jgi:2-C-methyl-D-erythritol 2,4-cyclodiphosphate synthase
MNMNECNCGRVGFGYDAHRLVLERKLILGGVHIPYARGLLGHSDADALIHAVMDALLGAAALGDIGKYFPDTDEEYRGADSLVLLAKVRDIIKSAGYKTVNTDSTICAQKPKLAEYICQMRQNIADALEIDITQVSVKATTTEKLGFVGNEEGISAYAVCAIERTHK